MQTLFKKFSSRPNSQTAPKMSIESGKYMFHYLINQGVCFMSLTERGYPKKLVFQYLEELASEFSRLYSESQLDTVTRPYAFIKFGEAPSALCFHNNML